MSVLVVVSVAQKAAISIQQLLPALVDRANESSPTRYRIRMFPKH